MAITNFCVRNSDGKKIPADPVGNNLAFPCFLCGHPVLLTTFLGGQGKDSNNLKSCRRKICDAQYFMEVRENEKTVIIHVEAPSPDSIKKNMGPDELERTEIKDGDLEAELRRTIHANLKQSAEIGMLYNKVLNFLCSLIPDKPSKELKKTDPDEYKKEKSLRNAAKKELASFVITVKKSQAKEAEFHKQERNRRLQFHRWEQEQLLVQQFPQLRDPDERDEFYEMLRKSGKIFGFSDEEVIETHDPRVLRLLYYAWKGKTAEITDNGKLN